VSNNTVANEFKNVFSAIRGCSSKQLHETIKSETTYMAKESGNFKLVVW